MRLPIHFIDHAGKITHDYVEGWPVVDVDIEVGFVAPSDPKGMFVPKFHRIKALIDTGANNTVITDRFASGATPLYSVPSQNVGVPQPSNVYNALVEIIGLDTPIMLHVGSVPALSCPAPMLLGRNLLSKYRMVYDTPRGDFYLEKL